MATDRTESVPRTRGPRLFLNVWSGDDVKYPGLSVRPLMTFCVGRPQSWGASQGKRVEYHCLAQLSHFIEDPSTSPHPAPISSTTNNITTITTTTASSEEESECPQSSLAQCTCQLELELSGDHTTRLYSGALE